jgi:5'-nucleotidase/UDP-sugar diphosphatase
MRHHPALPAIAAVLLCCSAVSAEVRSLTILHTNDLHARLSPLENQHGGFAYLASVIARERANCTDCILLNAGDLVQGTPVSTVFRGLPVFEIGNMLGYDAATLGNHDFDYGWRQTKTFVQIANYPIVSSNIADASGELLQPPYVILKVNGLRVAVVGAMTEELKTLSSPKLLEQWHTVPLLATVRKYAAELREKSDLIVLLGHITETEENRILQSAPEIPVVVSGHVHRGLEAAVEREGRLVVRVKGYGEELGRLELQVDTEKKAPVAWKWRHILVDSTAVQPDDRVARVVKEWEDKVSALVDQPVAVSSKPIGKAGVKRLIEEAMRDELHTDFAFMNMGGVRDVLPAGQILARHIWNIMPFDNLVVTGQFKGSELPKVVVGDRKIDPDREYTLAVSDFTATNQGTPESLQVTGLKFSTDGPLMRNILLEWFRKKKALD